MSHGASTRIIKVLLFFTVILTIILIFIVPKACLVVSNTFSRMLRSLKTNSPDLNLGPLALGN